MNYPSSQVSETTSKLSTQNEYEESSTYTDKYFNQSMVDTSKTGEYMSLTGQPADMSYFRHNNMAPFFGLKSHANNSSNATESQLYHKNGSGSQYTSKKSNRQCLVLGTIMTGSMECRQRLTSFSHE